MSARGHAGACGFLEEALARIEAGEKQAVRHYAELERRLLAIENSRFLRTLQWPGRIFGDWKGRLGHLLLHSPLHPLYLKLVNPHSTVDRYQLWVESEQPPAERNAARTAADQHDSAGVRIRAGSGWKPRWLRRLANLRLLAALRVRRCFRATGWPNILRR